MPELLLVFTLFIGSHSVNVDHGSRSRTEVFEPALRRLLI
jgi:hypothetical protein